MSEKIQDITKGQLPTDAGSQRAVALAKEDIERFLQPGWEWGLHFGTGYVTSNEQEAAQLVAHAEANIPNAHGLVVPHSVIHGALKFY